MKLIPSQKKRTRLYPQLTRAQMLTREAPLRWEMCPLSQPHGGPGVAKAVLQVCSLLQWHHLAYCSPCDCTENGPKIVLERLDVTLASWVWLGAQIRMNNNPRQSAPVAGWARPKASEAISATREVMSGHGLGAGIEMPPTSRYFLSPRKGRRVILVPFCLYSWLV